MSDSDDYPVTGLIKTHEIGSCRLKFEFNTEGMSTDDVNALLEETNRVFMFQLESLDYQSGKGLMTLIPDRGIAWVMDGQQQGDDD